MRGGRRWPRSTVALGAAFLAAALTAPSAGAVIKVTREDNVLAKFRTLDCTVKKGRPAFKATGRANGWAFRANIYTGKLDFKEIYDVEYGDNSPADVLVFPPSIAPFTNINEPKPGQDVLGDAGGVGFAKKGKEFGVGLPLIYNSERTNPPPDYVSVSGLADCKY